MKSRKLIEEEQAEEAKKSVIIPMSESYRKSTEDGPTKIKPIHCLNEFVAVLVTAIESTIELTGATRYKNEGMVVGVGLGATEGRTPSQLQLGDVVLFRQNNVVMQLDAEEGFYQNQRVVIISEKSLICKLPQKPFTVVE